MTATTQALHLTVGDDDLAAILVRPTDSVAAFVFAHGAGAGMHHVFMEDFATGLATRRIASLRYQFPFMERGSGRPDRPDVAHAAVRAACAMAASAFAGLPLFAGGKSFGGRMTSQAQALEPLPGIVGLVFVGFPLHPAGKPGLSRAEHLASVRCPMLFLQGTRDALAEPELMTGVVASLGDRAALAVFEDADHSFHVRKSSGSDDERTLGAMLDATGRWVERLIR